MLKSISSFLLTILVVSVLLMIGCSTQSKEEWETVTPITLEVGTSITDINSTASPEVNLELAEQTMTPIASPTELVFSPSPSITPLESLLPEFDISWTVSRKVWEGDGKIVDLSNYHPSPSVVGLPNEIPGRGLPTDPEQLRYLDCPRVNATDLGGGNYLVGFDDTYIYQDDRGLKNFRNPTYEELVNFLSDDKTNEREHIYGSHDDIIAGRAFICTDFAIMLRENANAAGFRCAAVGLPTLHTINAFQTIDLGLVWVEPQNDGLYEPWTTRKERDFRLFGEAIQFGKEDEVSPMEGILVYVW